MREKKITEEVSIETYDDSMQGADVVCHYCPGVEGGESSKLMIRRENKDGPMYWCTGCGYTINEGVAMAIRLNEVNI